MSTRKQRRRPKLADAVPKSGKKSMYMIEKLRAERKKNDRMALHD